MAVLNIPDPFPCAVCGKPSDVTGHVEWPMAWIHNMYGLALEDMSWVCVCQACHRSLHVLRAIMNTLNRTFR